MAPEQILGGAVDQSRRPVLDRRRLLRAAVLHRGISRRRRCRRSRTASSRRTRCRCRDSCPTWIPTVLPIIERALKKNPDERLDDAESLRAGDQPHSPAVRRRLRGAVAPTILRRDTPPQRPNLDGPGPDRSSGRSARIAVGVATPPPNDREALARRRAAQLEAALAQARYAAGAGRSRDRIRRLSAGANLDEQHPGALELEVQIRAAFAERQVEALDDGRRRGART